MNTQSLINCTLQEYNVTSTLEPLALLAAGNKFEWELICLTTAKWN